MPDLQTLKALSDHGSMLIILITHYGFSSKLTCAFLLQKNIWDLSYLHTFEPRKTTISSKFDRGLKVNRALPSFYKKSLDIKL